MGIEQMATLLKYADLVEVNMSADNDVNFADIEDYGHRVVVEVETAKLNAMLQWERAAGADRPTAKIADTAAFRAGLIAGLLSTYVDIDGVTDGLHFGTSNMDLNSDPRLRLDQRTSINDLPMAFVLYKLYGSSAITTLNNIFNLEDAQGMIFNGPFADAMIASFEANEAGAVDAMFRDLLAACPQRYFDASGIPVTGIFETNTDVSGSGSWSIIDDDIIEVKVKFVFQSTVTRRGAGGREHDLTGPSAGGIENEQVIISPGDYFYIRIQMKAVGTAPTPYGAYTPTMSPGLQVWLDMADSSKMTKSGSTITAIQDKSDNALTVSVVGAPTVGAGLNSKQTVAVNNTGFTVSLPANLGTTSFTSFFVWKANTHNAAQNPTKIMAFGPGFHAYHPGLTGGGYQFNLNGGDPKANITSVLAGSYRLTGARRTTGAIYVSVNGEESGNSGSLSIATGTLSFAPAYASDIAEILFFTGDMSLAARQQIEGYLAHKWGLQGSLPVSHPFKTSAP
jgi:hypothetical protein